MDASDRRKILKNFPLIKKELAPRIELMLNFLIDEGVFSQAQKKEIMKRKLVGDKMRAFLECLLDGGPTAYRSFVIVLTRLRDYGHIIKALENTPVMEEEKHSEDKLEYMKRMMEKGFAEMAGGFAAMDDHLKNITEQVQVLQMDKSDYEKELKEKEKIIEENKARIQNLEEQMKTLQNQSDRNADLVEEKEKLLKQIAYLQTNIHKLQSEIDELRRKLHENANPRFRRNKACVLRDEHILKNKK